MANFLFLLTTKTFCIIETNRFNIEKVLVTFDGWSSDYDYWADIDTPDIHPIGYSD